MSSLSSKIIFFGLFLYSCIANAWTINSDFETGSDGDSAKGSRAFSEAFTKSKISTDVVNLDGGTRSAKVGISAGTDGWGNWGGVYTFPTKLVQGDEIWFRAYVYYPLDFDYKASGQGLKTMRIHTGKNVATGGNEGYFDVLTSGSGLSIGSEITNDHYTNNSRSEWANQGVRVAKGKWTEIEMYVKFSSVSGQGIYRVWQNGTLIFEDKKTKTLRSSTSVSDYVYLFTYWNGGAPATQSAYVDDITITTDTPSKVDSFGNRYIGSKYISPKAPVSSVY